MDSGKVESILTWPIPTSVREIVFRSGKEQGKSDALSRRSNYQPQNSDETVTQQHTILLKTQNLYISATFTTPINTAMRDRIRNQLRSDPLALDIIKHKELPDNGGSNKRSDYHMFQFSDGGQSFAFSSKTTLNLAILVLDPKFLGIALMSY
ncbi:10556_t:CDS:2 [Scutellospora calospora]|uniref:10556_t:CDS:1 n=1 Tax=Scutellospora calospora TaxID=85575 RepID=A0ACA9KTG0_9GLOM|nr:10556_t:CDS:2 [Scutellospora calospora]